MWLIPVTEDSSQEERWEWFMEHYTERMQRVLYYEALKILRNHDDTADVMQEALLLGATRCHQLHDEERLFQWMFSIVRRLALRHIARSTPSLLIKLQQAALLFPQRVSLDDYLLKEDERQHLLAAIDRLKSPGREIIRMKYTGVWNLRLIAEELHLNYHTTRSIYQRARRELIKELEAYYEKDR